MKNIVYIIILTALLLVATACQQKTVKGMYEYDTAFFKAQGVEFIELSDSLERSKVLIVPAFQGRVMTSTASGNRGVSYGWINHDLIKSKKLNSNFNPFGGEERFWLGPEGGPFSFYFDQGVEQDFNNWRVPSVIDTESFDLIEKNSEKVTFSKQTEIQNAYGTLFKMDICRSIYLLYKKDIEDLFKINLEESLGWVAYKSDNRITNIGNKKWDKTSGLPSIWLLSMFDAGESSVVFIPYHSNAEGVIVKDDYFGKVPLDRLIIDDKLILFNVDGKLRSKIGLPYHRAKNICGSYDIGRNLLTLVWFNLPGSAKPYVNSQWGDQQDPFDGDVINSYNDGPLEDGTVMGPFYELETSSPALELSAGESYTHEQCVVHIEGNMKDIEKIVYQLFDVKLERIINVFK